MGREATPTSLSEHERSVLESWVRSRTTQQRHVFRASIILMAAEGHTNVSIAEELHTRPPTVGQWRKCCATTGSACSAAAASV